MKTIDIVGENYCGNWDKTRTACRGIVIDGDRILLSYAVSSFVFSITKEKNRVKQLCVDERLNERCREFSNQF